MNDPADPRHPVVPDGWEKLKAFTAARIALGRTGVSIPLREVLQFRMAHAFARDAVFSAADRPLLRERLAGLQLEAINVDSQAPDRTSYLQRPDLGRRLADSSREALRNLAPGAADLCLVIADGLSAEAVNTQAIPLIAHLLPLLTGGGYLPGPVALVAQGRVAIGDEIGALLQVRLVIVLIGERPGLSSPDSLGAYITFRPLPGTTDEARNCVSNIRPEGLGFAAAAEKIFYLVREALRREISGVSLKEETGRLSES